MTQSFPLNCWTNLPSLPYPSIPFLVQKWMINCLDYRQPKHNERNTHTHTKRHKKWRRKVYYCHRALHPRPDDPFSDRVKMSVKYVDDCLQKTHLNIAHFIQNVGSLYCQTLYNVDYNKKKIIEYISRHFSLRSVNVNILKTEINVHCVENSINILRWYSFFCEK